MCVDINIQTLEIHSRDVMVFGLIHFFVIHVMLVDYSTEINDLFNCRFICCCFNKKNAYYSCILQVKEKWMNCIKLKFAKWLKNLNNVITKCVWPPRRNQQTNWCDKTFGHFPLESWNETKWNFCFSQRILAFLRDFFLFSYLISLLSISKS